MSASAFEQSRLDDYEIAGPLGSGATARVFEARHTASGRAVAIKMLDASARGNRELRERLAREAAFLAGVQSPYVSRLLGFGWESDQPFLVLERLDGETLGDVLKREARLDATRLVEWIEQLLIGLRDCHNANVIHRDVKPSNIFLALRKGGDPVVKLIDFGVARLNEIAKAGASLTSTHHLIGSMGYMAPEQLEYAKGVAPGADLYAVGVVIFRCVTGRLPFVGRSFEALTKLKCESTAPRLSSIPGVATNPLLEEFVAKALARNLGDRYQSASEMLQEWWRVAAALDRDVPLAEGHDVVFEEEEPSNTLVDALHSDSHPTNPTHSSAGPATERSLPASLLSTTLVEKDLPTDTGSNPLAVPVAYLPDDEDTERPTKKRAL
jgi:serine/threonine-protein kinase